MNQKPKKDQRIQVYLNEEEAAEIRRRAKVQRRGAGTEIALIVSDAVKNEPKDQIVNYLTLKCIVETVEKLNLPPDVYDLMPDADRNRMVEKLVSEVRRRTGGRDHPAALTEIFSGMLDSGFPYDPDKLTDNELRLRMMGVA